MRQSNPKTHCGHLKVSYCIYYITYYQINCSPESLGTSYTEKRDVDIMNTGCENLSWKTCTKLVEKTQESQEFTFFRYGKDCMLKTTLALTSSTSTLGTFKMLIIVSNGAKLPSGCRTENPITKFTMENGLVGWFLNVLVNN